MRWVEFISLCVGKDLAQGPEFSQKLFLCCRPCPLTSTSLLMWYSQFIEKAEKKEMFCCLFGFLGKYSKIYSILDIAVVRQTVVRTQTYNRLISDSILTAAAFYGSHSETHRPVTCVMNHTTWCYSANQVCVSQWGSRLEWDINRQETEQSQYVSHRSYFTCCSPIRGMWTVRPDPLTKNGYSSNGWFKTSVSHIVRDIAAMWSATTQDTSLRRCTILRSKMKAQ